MSNFRRNAIEVFSIILALYLILSPLAQISLGRVGVPVQAQVTSVHRPTSGEDRQPTVRYRFQTGSNEYVSGSFRTRKPALYQTPNGYVSIHVRYFGLFPKYNKVLSETSITFRHIWSILMGCLFLIISNKHVAAWRRQKFLAAKDKSAKV